MMMTVRAERTGVVERRSGNGHDSGFVHWGFLVEDSLGLHNRPSQKSAEVFYDLKGEVGLAKGIVGVSPFRLNYIDGKEVVNWILLAARCGERVCLKVRAEDDKNLDFYRGKLLDLVDEETDQRVYSFLEIYKR